MTTHFLLSFLANICVLGTIILFHELGHFLAAKRTGMGVQEFSIGAGPSLYRWKRGETTYHLRLFLFMGWVKIAGMEPGEEAKVENGFYTRPVGQRLMVLLAGGLMNLCLAVLAVWTMGLAFGKPGEPTSRIAKVLHGRPAEKAGLQVGDVIVGINGKRTREVQTIYEEISNSPGRPVELVVEREGQELVFTITTYVTEEQSLEGPPGEETIVTRRVGKIGIVFTQTFERLSLGEVFQAGFVNTARVVVGFTIALWRIITGTLPAEVGGPVRLVQEINLATYLGLYSVLQLVFQFTIIIGLINLFPFPALDGGRMVFQLLEWVYGRPVVSRRKEAAIHAVGLVMLLSFMLLISFNDVRRILHLRQLQ
ncbi:MAG TPA: PDZ domain-containing protein [Armatimonadetes bacterium]|nr:PDZ domain-containing protein [Armatimonadota bacterium]